jgi:argininosuccinate lyase
MKLWDKGYTVDTLVDQFTVGNDRELDLKLAKYDVQGNAAHAKMLNKIGLLTRNELDDLLGGLKKIQEQIDKGEFTIEEQFEDVHSKIEFELTQLIGEAGKKIHTARSRNDQVLVDLHLYVKDEMDTIKGLMKSLFSRLLNLSEQHKNHLIPGYTHMQVAMPSSFGMWFSSYAEILIDDLIMLKSAYAISDQNPLGSAAGYGSSFEIDRQMTTELLGFSTLKINSVAAQLSRGKLEKTVGFALASIASTLSKLSADICMYMSQNFDFVSFPKELTTGSSIMPHKQNPDVFELIRAKANKIQNLPVEFTMIVNNLTSGYHRDFQLLKETLMGGIDQTKEILEVCEFMLQHIQIKKEITKQELYDYLFSVEEVNRLVKDGMSFRDAYQQLGKQILKGEFQANRNISHSHIGSIGNLALEQIQKKWEMNDF